MLRTIFTFAVAGSLAFAQAKPAPKKKTTAAAASSNKYKNMTFPPLRDVEIPKVEKFTLANGMKVYLLENHELPLISGRALVRVGNLFDPKDKEQTAARLEFFGKVVAWLLANYAYREGAFMTKGGAISLVDGEIIWAPAIAGAFVLSTRGGDFDLHVGQDFSIGYFSHTDTTVRLYLQESFTFLMLTAEAAVALAAAPT